MSKILFVDDDPVNREVLFEVFDESGHELREAESGEAALTLVRDWQPEIVLLDIMMPGVDGYEVCRRIRADETLSDTKVILVSAKALTSERMRGYEAGADDYVTKPFEVEELRAKVEVFVKLHRAEQLQQLKDELLAFLAHEVRTPMTGIAPAAELLLNGDAHDEAEREEFMEMILDSSKRLLASTDRALLLASLRSCSYELNLEQFELRLFLQERIGESLPSSTTIEACADQELAVRADRKLLAQAVRILAEESERLQSQRLPVRIALCETGKQAQLRIGRSEGELMSSRSLLNPDALHGVTESELGFESLALMLVQAIAETSGGALCCARAADRSMHFVLQLGAPIAAPA